MDTVFSHPLVTTVIAAFLLLGIIGKLAKFSFRTIARWYLYVAVFAVIIVMDSIFFPFIGGKDYFFRFAVELSLASLVLWWAFEAKKGEAMQLVKETFRKPLVKAVTIFTGAYLLACAFAYDAYAAFWSNYERGEGGFQMLHYWLFFLLLTMLLTTEKEWKNIFKFSLIAAGVMIIYGILGNYSVNTFIGPYAGATPPTGWWNILIQGRFQGSLGNPAYVDPYLIFSMFFAAYLWVSQRMEGTLTAAKSWMWAILEAVLLFFFILGQTRGAFLGLAAGIFFIALYLVFSQRGNVRKWGAIVLIVLVILGLGLYALRNNPTVDKLPEARLLQISLSDSTAQTRFWVWGEAWQGFLQKPLFGWGPENFTTVFDKFFNPNFYMPGQNSETWFDRAHSVYFDYLAETGIVGLLAYLAIFVTFFWEFFKKSHKEVHSEAHSHHRLAIALRNGLVFVVPIAYLVQGIAIFDVLPMYLSLFLFLAFSSYYFSHKNAHA